MTRQSAQMRIAEPWREPADQGLVHQVGIEIHRKFRDTDTVTPGEMQECR
jgi:hypothetical protein